MKEDIIDRINMLLCEKDIASAGFKKIRDLPESLDLFKTSDWQILEYLLSVQDKKIDHYLFVHHFDWSCMKYVDEQMISSLGTYTKSFIRRGKRYYKRTLYFDDIYTDRLKLTRPTKKDAKELCKHFRDDGDFFLYIGEYYSKFEAQGQADLFLESLNSYSIRLKSGEMVGIVTMNTNEYGFAELSYYIFKQMRRNGYCTEACRAVIDEAFSGRFFENIDTVENNHRFIKKMPKEIVTIKAKCFTFNEASNQALKSLGFTYSGYDYKSCRLGNGEWASDNLYYLDRETYRKQ